MNRISPPFTPEPKVLQGFQDWLVAKNLKPASVKNYLFYMDKFSWPMNQASVDTFLNTYNNSIARSFVQNFKAYALRHNNSNEFLEALKVEIPKITGRKKVRIPKVLTTADVLAIANVMDNERNKIMILLNFYAGLRIQELIRITPYSFKWKEWRAAPHQSGEVFVIGKGDKERVAFLPAWLMDRIQIWVRNVASKTNPDPRSPLFVIGKRRWQYILARASKKALGYHVNPHLLRHSCATWLIGQGMSIENVKEALGHESIATTQFYVHINKEEVKKKYSQIQSSKS